MRWVYSLCVRTTPDVPKQLSTMAMRLALASLCTALSEGEGQSVTRGDWSGRGGVGRGRVSLGETGVGGEGWGGAECH